MNKPELRTSPHRRPIYPEAVQVRLIHPSYENIRRNWSDVSKNGDRDIQGSESSIPPADLSVSYDSAIELAESGNFHIIAMLTCGLVFLFTGLVPNTMNYLIQSVECDFHLNVEDKKTINDITYCGMLSGTVLWAVLSGNLGPRAIFVIVTGCNALSATGVCLSKDVNVNMFMICRFFWSFCAAGALCLAITYVAEVLPPQHRGSAVSCLQIFYIAGIILVPALSMSWRCAVGLSAAVALIAAVIMLILPESPRFLVTQGRQREAIEALQTIFSWNTYRPRDKYPVKILRDNPNACDLMEREMMEYVPTNLRPRWYCIPVVMMSQFCLMYSYYTLSLWYEDLVGHHEAFFHVFRQLMSSTPNCELGELPRTEMQHPTLILPPPESVNFSAVRTIDPCRVGTIDFKEQPFMRLLLAQFASLSATLWLISSLDTLGRKVFIPMSHLLAGCFIFSSYFLHARAHDIIFTCLFEAVCIMSKMPSFCLAVELSDTRYRPTGVACVMAMGQLGAILGDMGFVLSLDITCVCLVSVMAITTSVAGLLVLSVPDTVGMTLR